MRFKKKANINRKTILKERVEITRKRFITALIFAIASISVAAEGGYSLDKIRAIFIEQSYSKKYGILS